LIIDSPLTSSVKTVSLEGIRVAGKSKNSLGRSIASIGFPAVTFPSNGTLITSSSLSEYSFSTKISMVRNLLLDVLITPASSNFLTCV